MAIFKCKMCGGNLEIKEGMTVAECEYCGTKQTVPQVMDENLQNLFNRANTLRIKSEFDKAEKLYEKIIQADSTQADAYWGLILCKYGIEYVDDPKTYQKIPTCHRASYDSIIADEDYKSAIANADMSQRAIYEAQAKEIDRIQKEILALAQKEENYDVFICYKETDASGRRTQDSVIANDIYYQLTNEGFKVFYAAITLEGKLGSAYEPIIFAALNSAKVMLAIGTNPEYFNAVWVKNEWSRYLKLMQKDRSKLLIPCYRDMDAYELPEEFAHLQAQDMSKIGFINDIVRGIQKIIKKDEPKVSVVKETVMANGGANAAPLLERVFMFLEDGDWSSANEYCEKVLDIDPKCAEAYLGKLMAELKVKKREWLKEQEKPFDGNGNYQKVIRFGDDKLKNELTGYIEYIHLEDIYTKATRFMDASDYHCAADLFQSISNYKDSSSLANHCLEKKHKYEQERSACELLFAELKAFYRNKTKIEQEKMKIKQEIAADTSRLNLMISIKNEWNNIEESIRVNEDKILSIQMEISKLNEEKMRLGIFSGKRKKEIELRILDLESYMYSLKRSSVSLSQKHQGYQSFEEIYKKCDNVQQRIKLLEKNLNELDERSDTVIRLELSQYDFGKMLLKKYDDLKNAKSGDYIKFGSYLQDNKASATKDYIDWVVLKAKDDKLLVISKYALDAKPYNTTRENLSWESCTLRKWLNNEFFNTAFSIAEQAMIPTVTVLNKKNPDWGHKDDKETQDKVFLLSIDEADEYFRFDYENELSSCKPTDYTIAKGAYVNPSNGGCLWWLRSPGTFTHYASYVHGDGAVEQDGAGVNDAYEAFEFGEDGEMNELFDAVLTVRPAMWIDLNA